MKKTLIGLVLVSLLLVTGCTLVAEKGDYKEGTYFGYVEDTKNGVVTITSAVLYVNENGMIKSVFIDSTYNKDSMNTSKKALGDAYGMKATSAGLGVIPGGAEWYEQAKSFEKKIVDEQGLEWLTWKDEAKTKTDSVSGVTITVSSYYKAVENALSQAK